MLEQVRAILDARSFSYNERDLAEYVEWAITKFGDKAEAGKIAKAFCERVYRSQDERQFD